MSELPYEGLTLDHLRNYTYDGLTHFETEDIYALLAESISAHAARLDSHNRVMESIVRRVRALEGGGGSEDFPLEQQRDDWRARAERLQEQADGWRFNHGEAVKRAETAERERDEALQHVEQLKFFNQANFDEATKARNERDAARASAERLKPYARHFASCSRDATMNAPCTCGLTAALEDA